MLLLLCALCVLRPWCFSSLQGMDHIQNSVAGWEACPRAMLLRVLMHCLGGVPLPCRANTHNTAHALLSRPPGSSGRPLCFIGGCKGQRGHLGVHASCVGA